MIAHRLSTLDYCEAVIELDHGRIVDGCGLSSKGEPDHLEGEVAQSGAR
jgi:hypothetical protein